MDFYLDIGTLQVTPTNIFDFFFTCTCTFIKIYSLTCLRDSLAFLSGNLLQVKKNARIVENFTA